MLIRLYDSDNEGLVLVFADKVEDAIENQYIDDNRWDIDGSSAAFAYVNDRSDLVAHLTGLGYEVDDQNYTSNNCK